MPVLTTKHRMIFMVAEFTKTRTTIGSQIDSKQQHSSQTNTKNQVGFFSKQEWNRS